MLATLQDGETAVLHKPPPAETPIENIHGIPRENPKTFGKSLENLQFVKFCKLLVLFSVLFPFCLMKGKMLIVLAGSCYMFLIIIIWILKDD